MTMHRAETMNIVARNGAHGKSSGKVKDRMITGRTSSVTEQPAEASSSGKKTGKVVSALNAHGDKGAKSKPKAIDKAKQREAPAGPVRVAVTDKQGEPIN